MALGSCLLSLAGWGDGLGWTLCVCVWSRGIKLFMRLMGWLATSVCPVVLGDACVRARVLGIDSMNSTSSLFGLGSFESMQSCSRAFESCLKLKELFQDG